VLIKGTVKLFHATQIEGGVEQLRHWPISGGSRKLYLQSGDPFKILHQAGQAKNYSSGLWFSKRQLDGLMLAAKSGEAPTLVPMSGGSIDYAIYNIEQLEDPEMAKAIFGGRAELGTPSFLVSGETIRAADKVPVGKYQSCYWISHNEAIMYELKIKPSELNNGIFLFSKTAQHTEMFNVDQLSDPQAGYQKAGLLIGS
jgi:hypothetical protein